VSILLGNVLFGGISSLIAHSKSRNALGWFLVGCLVGPFALLVVLLPMALREGSTRKCPQCSEVVRSDARICRYCRSALSAGSSVPDGRLEM
jgi:hypothetical protein